MKKSSVLVPTRQDGTGGAAKLALVKPDNKFSSAARGNAALEFPKSGDRKMSNIFARKLIMKRDDSTEGSDDAGSGKRGSIFPSSSGRPSVSAGSGPRLSIAGLMASRRFAKKLMGRALDKRESTIGDVQPTVNYEPTYRLEPKVKFQTSPVLEIIKDVVENRVRDMKYNPRIAPNMNRILGDEVKERVKKLLFDRYKIVVIIMIGEKKDQGIMVSSRCSWDDKFDNYVTHTFQNKHIFCTCSVYGTYHE